MAIHPQSTVVRLDRLPYARQAESRAVDASNVTPATERFEHEWQITSWNSEALVGNAEHGPGSIWSVSSARLTWTQLPRGLYLTAFPIRFPNIRSSWPAFHGPLSSVGVSPMRMEWCRAINCCSATACAARATRSVVCSAPLGREQ